MYAFIFILDVNFLRENDGPVASLILFIEYGPSLILLAYLFSFMFSSGSKGQMIVFLFVYLGSFAFSIASFVLRLVSSTRDVHDNGLVWVFRLLPFYDFTVSFIHMGNTSLYQIFYKWDSMPDYLTSEIALIEIIFLICTFLMMSLLLVWIENWIKFAGLFKKNKEMVQTDQKSIPKEVREHMLMESQAKSMSNINGQMVSEALTEDDAEEPWLRVSRQKRHRKAQIRAQ